jgi:quercetin dioxygenase-like cupin family protein
MASSFFIDYRSFLSFKANGYGKATLFENEHILVGLNCLEPGQFMEKHAHREQDRFYLVLEGKGFVQVGDEKQEAGQGMVIWVPSGNPHRLENNSADRMVFLVGIAPAHAD